MIPSMGSGLVIIYSVLCPFRLCCHLDGDERASCFALIVFLVSCDCCRYMLFLAVHWVDLQRVILVFSDHTRSPL